MKETGIIVFRQCVGETSDGKEETHAINMSPNRRIILNIVATYGRSLYALVIGLFCGRWALMALGQSDFGLIGLIGGMTAFVSFLNSILAAAVGRFYAVKVGEAKRAKNYDEGVEGCRKWFNTALSIHSVIPVVLVITGYPVGVWLVQHFLTIPPERIGACIMVWRFTCITCFVAMFNVPFRAMYTAKQEIAELTIYSFATTTLNAFFLYYMISHPGFWLVRYAGWMCFVGVAPQLIIAIRALFKYQECRFVRAYLWSADRYMQLLRFVIAQFWSNFSSIFSSQGQAILVNKYMGATYNASMSIGNTVASQALTLSSSLDGAFWPAITNKTGERDEEGVRKLCYMSMRISTVLVLVFAIPLSLEIKEVLRLWLVTPPDFSAEICLIVLARAVLERMTMAYATAIYGYGNGVMRYSWSVGWAGISTVMVSWLFFALGFRMWSIVIGLAFSKLVTVGVRLYLGRILIRFGFWYWVRAVFFPIVIVVSFVLACGIFVRMFMDESFCRIIVTTIVCEVAFLPACWFLVFSKTEKKFIENKINAIVNSRKGKE